MHVTNSSLYLGIITFAPGSARLKLSVPRKAFSRKNGRYFLLFSRHDHYRRIKHQYFYRSPGTETTRTRGNVKLFMMTSRV
jgi:hypothetical protein